MQRLTTTTRTLVLACHPVPCVAVTSFAVALGATAGNSPATCTTLAVAILAGQLSIGWSNDRIDVELDRSSGRADKPLARGTVAPGVVDRAIAGALLVTVAASLALGWRAGLLHLVAVAFGWLYNLGLKATMLSWLPYTVAFGSLPGVATLALPGHQAPAPWAVGAAALLGGTAHFTNALPDLIADEEYGIRGFPHRIGARASVVLGAVASLVATALLVLGPRGDPSPERIAGLVLAAVWTVAGCALAWRRPQTPLLFYGTLAVVVLDLALLIAGPSFVR